MLYRPVFAKKEFLPMPVSIPEIHYCRSCCKQAGSYFFLIHTQSEFRNPDSAIPYLR
jgi:hypothetical protein